MKTAPGIASLDTSWKGIFPGEGPSYIEHAHQGVLHAANNPNALLVFSGGQTREAAGKRSEAESYWAIANDADWWETAQVRGQAHKEEYARDSFENLLFSLAVFKRETTKWPDKVTVCGWKFKEKRYDLHRQALKWPKKTFTYIGVNDPVAEALPKALAGEQDKIQSVNRDLFLVGPEWVAQREQRNPFHRQHPYRGIDASLDPFLDFLDRNTFTGALPWL